MNNERLWDVLGIGDADVDLFLKVDRLPGRDDKVLGAYVGEFPGGIVANFCCAASRLGTRTALASTVGDDRYGAMTLAGLRECGVDISEVRVRQGGQTYFCIVLLDGTGEKALTVVQTDCTSPGRADLDPKAFGRARLVHTTVSDLDLTLWVAREAKERGTIVSIDVEPTTGRELSDLENLLRHVDLVFPNAAGLGGLFSGDLLEGAQQILHMGPKVVVVTMGADGYLVASRDGTPTFPAYRVPVTDTTGAGDAFNGAFVSGFLQGWDLARCGRFAAATAAISITDIGARTALPNQRDVEAFLMQTDGCQALPN